MLDYWLECNIFFLKIIEDVNFQKKNDNLVCVDYRVATSFAEDVTFQTL